MSQKILSLAIRYEQDIVLARQRARQIAFALGLDASEQTRISTAVSEISRNAFSYGGGGRIEFALEGKTAPQVLMIRIRDDGPGIENLDAILEGRYRSPHGMGVGILGARRLMDQFDIESRPGAGTTVVLRKLLVRQTSSLAGPALAEIAERLARDLPHDAMEELQQQNQELLRTLQELTEHQSELKALNRELEDTNRGVVALYAELDEKADHLRRADEIKSRFISNMSHEFRTPVHSIQALAALLLSRSDGELSLEQERQVTFIRKAADALAELVNDLLDLAKVEAGKTVVHPTEFTISTLFGTLRGMLRPLLLNESVNLVFEDPEDLPPLYSDEGKLSQILRNFISNALKFTERGEVRVRACRVGNLVAFSVSDTGIGIPAEDQERIFQEFTQIDSPLQRRVKGTGLGLPLCRKLAGLLNGSVRVESEPGIGSTFTLEIPLLHEPPSMVPLSDLVLPPGRVPILVLEDQVETLLLYERYLSDTLFAPLPARSLREARQILQAVTPSAAVVDIVLQDEDAWEFLAELKSRSRTPAIPVLVLTAVEDQAKGLALGADAYALKPIDRASLVRTLTRLTSPESMRKVLIVDDDEIARYVLRQSLLHSPHVILEAGTGLEGLRLAEAEDPDLIFLDLSMVGMDGFEVLRRLKEQSRTSNIPVVIVTSARLDETASSLLRQAHAVLFKEEISAERVQALVEGSARAMRRAS